MMQRMTCTYTELQEQPEEVLATIHAFLVGEEEAIEAQKPT